MCGHLVSAHGLFRSKGKDWQYCYECGTQIEPVLREIIAKADYTRWVVSRGTSKKKGWDLPDVPLF